MSLTPLDNPLERLGINPTGMNWRGLWDATEQYYLNDVAVAPSNSASYILANKTALLDGGDPSLNPDWIELSATTTGVVSVNAGTGITITGTGTNPIVNNAGVITLTAGTGLTNAGTATNPLINNTGVVSLVQGVGIQIAGTTNPTITNTGIRTLTQGAGIAISSGSNPSIANTGLLSAVAGTGISVSAGQTPTIANTGVVSLGVGSGIANTGTATAPVVENTGILTLGVGTGLATTGGQNPVLTATILPTLSRIICINWGLFGANPMDSVVNAPANITIGQANFPPASIIADHFANGSPDPAGVWLVDFSPLKFINIAGDFSPPAPLTISLVDNSTPATYVLSNAEGGSNLSLAQAPANGSGLSGANAQPFGFGLVELNITAIRASGFRRLDEIHITNGTGGIWWITTAPNVLFAQYYPNGVQ
jgi:hypothetical protein